MFPATGSTMIAANVRAVLCHDLLDGGQIVVRSEKRLACERRGYAGGIRRAERRPPRSRQPQAARQRVRDSSRGT